MRDWLRTAPQSKEETFKSPGLGDDVRLEGATLVGAGLLVEGRPVHVEVFANSDVAELSTPSMAGQTVQTA